MQIGRNDTSPAELPLQRYFSERCVYATFAPYPILPECECATEIELRGGSFYRLCQEGDGGENDLSARPFGCVIAEIELSFTIPDDQIGRRLDI